jgi:dTDP-4-amino-4,6-dideoxy-D-galactose acyltransferase
MVNNSCKYLAWDSDFFLKKIFRIDIRKNHDVDLINEVFNSLDCDLLYVFSEYDLKLKLSPTFFLADKKILFSKKIDKNLTLLQNSEITSVSKSSKKIYELAILSGIYSRFKLDPFLSNKFEQLYKLWLDKSITKEMASEVFVYFYNDIEIGLITVKKTENIAIVGLLAVDPLYASKKIGTSLMHSVENWCINNGVDEIHVATQIDNIKACNFYRKNGYITKQVDYIYHYYSKK